MSKSIALLEGGQGFVEENLLSGIARKYAYCAIPMPTWPDDQLTRAHISSAIYQTGSQGDRWRRLPAPMLLRVLVTQTFFPERPLHAVVDALGLYEGTGYTLPPHRSAVYLALDKFGPAAASTLFRISSQEWSLREECKKEWRGLTCHVMDGTVFRTPDSVLNRATFGAQKYANKAVSSYPQVRAVSVFSLFSRLASDISFGPYKTSEVRLAGTLIGKIPDHSVTLLDKGFVSLGLLHSISSNGQERHWIIPAKAHMKLEVIDGNSEDGLVEFKTTWQARKTYPALSRTLVVRAIHAPYKGAPNNVVLHRPGISLDTQLGTIP